MQKLPNPTRPNYPVGSVDKALRLIHMLRDHGEIRLRTAAEELGVSESTLHRLMAMLVYHGFARQEEGSRAYVPGYALGAAPVRISWAKTLRDVAMPHMERLSHVTGETTNLQVRVGTRIRFLWSHESSNILRIINRTGAVIPAVKAAGGRVMLADLPEETIRRLYQGPVAQAQGDAMTDHELMLFLRELQLHRHKGFATANEETEIGVTAVSMPIHEANGRVIAALTVSMPTSRYAHLFTPDTLRALAEARDAVEYDLHEMVPLHK